MTVTLLAHPGETGLRKRQPVARQERGVSGGCSSTGSSAHPGSGLCGARDSEAFGPAHAVCGHGLAGAARGAVRSCSLHWKPKTVLPSSTRPSEGALLPACLTPAL